MLLIQNSNNNKATIEQQQQPQQQQQQVWQQAIVKAIDNETQSVCVSEIHSRVVKCCRIFKGKNWLEESHYTGG